MENLIREKMMQQKILTVLNKLDNLNVFFGPQGFAFANTKEALQELQASYNYDGWQGTWLVIARDTEMGDPYFVDISSDDLVVYTAIHGEGEWQLEQVASSLAGFVKCMQTLTTAAKQEYAQMIPEDFTIQDNEHISSLEVSLIEQAQTKEFWQTFFACYKDWLSDDF